MTTLAAWLMTDTQVSISASYREDMTGKQLPLPEEAQGTIATTFQVV
jgi:hypothetical protein